MHVQASVISGKCMFREMYIRDNVVSAKCFSGKCNFGEVYRIHMCLFLLKQTIAQYNHNGSPVFVAFLDASKAFDKVNQRVLFKKLVEAKVQVIFVHL